MWVWRGVRRVRIQRPAPEASGRGFGGRRQTTPDGEEAREGYSGAAL